MTYWYLVARFNDNTTECIIIQHIFTIFEQVPFFTQFSKNTMLATGPARMLSALQDIQDLWIPRLSYSLILVGLQMMLVRHHLAEGGVTMLRFVKRKRWKWAQVVIQFGVEFEDSPSQTTRSVNWTIGKDLTCRVCFWRGRMAPGPTWRLHIQEHTRTAHVNAFFAAISDALNNFHSKEIKIMDIYISIIEGYKGKTSFLRCRSWVRSRFASFMWPFWQQGSTEPYSKQLLLKCKDQVHIDQQNSKRQHLSLQQKLWELSLCVCVFVFESR